jgi:DNA-directed RNA polymerase subunit M/transcription elongation factor TFIIS
MPRKRKSKQVLHCSLCQHFYDIPSKQRHIDGERTKIKRLCPVINDFVVDFSDVCKYFEPSKILYCYKDKNWMYLVACLNRLNNKTCVKCKNKKAFFLIQEKYLKESK